MRHILSVNDLTAEEIKAVFTGAITMEKSKYASESLFSSWVLPIAKMSLIFIEPSTRTRKSFKEAAEWLGFRVDEVTGGQDSSLAKGESLADTARMFSIYGSDILVVRTDVEGAPRFMQEVLDQDGYNTAVINGGDGMNQHPTQALVDFFTIARYFRGENIPNLTIGFMGDLETSRVVHSDLEMARILGVKKIILISASEAKVRAKYKSGFPEVVESEDFNDLSDCDVVIALRVQKERYVDPVKLKSVEGRFRITLDNIHLLKKEAIIMHPLPNPKNNGEIDPRLYNYKGNGGQKVVVHEQAMNGVSLRMWVLLQIYHGRRQKSENSDVATESVVGYDIIHEESAREYLKKQEGKSRDFFRPINPETGSGIIIDHLPLGQGIVVKNLLQKSFGKNALLIHLIENVRSGKYGKKDMLIIEGDCLLWQEKDLTAAISFLCGSQVTIHVIKDRMYRKVKIMKPVFILRFLRCPNPNCVTRHEPEAITKFFNRFPELGIMECGYCEREFSREELQPII